MKLNELKQKLNLTGEMDVLDKIALDVFDARTAKGWSQKELAEKIGTKQSVISRLESRGSDPTMNLLIKIANALDVPVYSPFIKPEDWYEIVKGSGRGLWGKDPDKYIENERNSWERTN
ncbi:MAG: helix-turn-helix transcriptional regulator [bacterium]